MRDPKSFHNFYLFSALGQNWGPVIANNSEEFHILYEASRGNLSAAYWMGGSTNFPQEEIMGPEQYIPDTTGKFSPYSKPELL